MARKKKKKWEEKQIDKMFAKYEAMSDDEFCSAYKREITSGIAISCLGVFVMVGCIIAMIVLM